MFNKKDKSPVWIAKVNPNDEITYETVEQKYTTPTPDLEIPIFMGETIQEFKFIKEGKDVYSVTKQIIEGDYTAVQDLHVKLTQDLLISSPKYRNLFIEAYLTEEYQTKDATYLFAMVKGGGKLAEPYYWTHKDNLLALEKMTIDKPTSLKIKDWYSLGINEDLVDFVPQELFEDYI